MQRTYTYPRWKPIMFVVLFCFPMIPLIKGFLYEAFPIESYTYSAILVVVVVLLTFALTQNLRGLSTKIIADASGIRIKRPFISYNLDWKDISEFGRYRRIVPWAGGIWVYYLRSDTFRNKRIPLASRGLIDLEDLVLFIIFKANNATLVNVKKAQKIND